LLAGLACIPLSTKKSMASLEAASFIGVIATGVIVVAILVDSGLTMAYYDGVTSRPAVVWRKDGADYPTALSSVGIIAFAYAVACLVPGIRMREEKSSFVFVSTHCVVMGVYALVTLVGFAAYGERAAKVKVIQEVMYSRWTSGAVTVAMLFNILVSIPLFLNPLGQSLERKLETRWAWPERQARYMVRIALVVLTTALAMPVDDPAAYQALSGDITTTCSCVIFPVTLHLAALRWSGSSVAPSTLAASVVVYIAAAFIMTNGILADGIYGPFGKLFIPTAGS